jgi:hypothetical protein
MKHENANIIQKKALYLSQIGEEFKLIRINNNFKLESTYFGNSSSKPMSSLEPTELGFVKRVKNHVKKHRVHEKFIDNFYYPSDINYVSTKNYEPGTKISNVIEIDIDEAYWKTAFNLGVIDDELYNEGSKANQNLSKIARLIALGSLAKQEDVYYFKGMRLMKEETKRSELTENIWYSICKKVSDVMSEAEKIANDNFLMFWVDGIYIKNEPDTVDKIKSLFTDNGYNVQGNCYKYGNK